jgi:hypothetical protein
MAERYGTIHVRRRRGVLVVIGQGKTGRGQSYTKRTEALESKKMNSPEFKSQLKSAIIKLYDSEA